MNFRSNPSTGSNANYLKLKDQESVVLALRGDPHEYYVTWENSKSTEVPEGTPKAQFRFRINVVMKENGAMVSKIWEQGATIYNQLKELHQEYDLEKTMLKVKRDGVGMDTAYSILPMRQELTPEQQKSIASVPLQDLAPKSKEPELSLNNEGEEINF